MRGLSPAKWILLTTTICASILACDVASASAVPVKEVVASHFGRGVDATTGGDICTVLSGDICQPGSSSGEGDGFQDPSGVAVGSTGNIFVADDANSRITEMTASGQFQLALGKNVNGSGSHSCVQTESINCRSAEEGSGPGEFRQPQDIIVDHASHSVYVVDLANWRVQKFTESGEFVLMFGKEVNETTKGDVCPEAVGDKCKVGVRGSEGNLEAGAFNWVQGAGDLIAVGGPEHLVYVGDEHRVQEFDSSGKFKRELLLTSLSATLGVKVLSLAVDQSGQIYLTYGSKQSGSSIVHKFSANGKEVVTPCTELSPNCWPLVVAPLHAGAERFSVTGVAVDTSGKLALSASEQVNVNTPATEWGVLVDDASASRVTDIVIAVASNGGMAFNESDSLYLAGTIGQEVVAYEALPVADLLALPSECKEQGEQGSDVQFNCTLEGQVNPDGVPNTAAWFEWGPAPTKTPEQIICTNPCGSVPVPISQTIEGVPPNERFLFDVRAYDENVHAPEEALSSEKETFVTLLVSPKVVALEVPFDRSLSAVLFAQLNPENAATRYWFEYAPTASCHHVEDCAQAVSTPVQESSRYGKLGTTQEVRGLQPATSYAYALVAESESQDKSEHKTSTQESVFTTAPTAVVSAETGPYSAVGVTSAIVSGTVNPDGQPSTYTFELGLAGGGQYGIVYSGDAGANTGPVNETLTLTDLQPGTRYDYRIAIHYGAGTVAGSQATGAPVEFTTGQLPELPVSGPTETLAPPAIPFPKPPPPCHRGYKRNAHGKCVKVKSTATKRRAAHKTNSHRSHGRKKSNKKS